MKKKTKKKGGISLAEHVLVPKHAKLSEKEKKELFDKYKITLKELPKIRKSDPAISKMNAEPGDIIKITRKSQTAGEALFYRGVIDG